MSDVWAILLGTIIGILAAPACALLLVAWLRARQARDTYVPWSVILAAPPPLPELPAPVAPLALPDSTESL